MKTNPLLICCALLLILGCPLCRAEATEAPDLILPLELPLQLAVSTDSLPVVTVLTLPRPNPEKPHMYLCPTQFRVWVPQDALALLLEVEPVSETSDAIDLYVRYGSPVTEDDEFVYSSAAAIGPGAFKRLEITPASEQPIAAGPLFIAIGSLSNEEVPVNLRLSCVVSELPEGAEGETSSVLNIPYVLVNIAHLVHMAIPSGWIPSSNGTNVGPLLAGFETPQAEGQPTAGRIEVSTWALNEVSDVGELQRRLDEIYTTRGSFELIAQRDLVIDEHEARSSLLIDESTSSGTLTACFIDNGSAWLISVTFTPLGYGGMYERIFETAVDTFRLDTGVEEQAPDASSD